MDELKVGSTHKLVLCSSCKTRSWETPDVVISSLEVFNFVVHVLLDLGANLSFVIPFLQNRFNICPRVLLEPFSECTLIDESIVTKRVYQNCLVLVLHKEFILLNFV